ncbi:MAG: glycosyltransferase [Bacteroidetes bacterium]|nr:glycosyltransferase [Bacteroidota bacterium]
MQTAPILLFAYKRPEQLRQTVKALQQNELARNSELFIFSDGPRSEADRSQVDQIRDYIRTIDGFRDITLFESTENKGLAPSIISGVSNLINVYDRVIVLEDDLVSSPNFLSFCNKALEHYRDDTSVFSIAGYTSPIRGLGVRDVYFTRRASSWGWATWRDRWNPVDWAVSDYAEFLKDRPAQRRFNEMGSDLTGMLQKQQRGKINSWAIRWCYHQFKNDQLTVYPSVSKITNIGFTEAASHTKGKYNSFDTELDTSNNFEFNFKSPGLQKDLVRQFRRPYSIPQRIKNKLLNTLATV